MLKLLRKWFGKAPRHETRAPMDMLRKTGSHRAIRPGAKPQPRSTDSAAPKPPPAKNPQVAEEPIIEEMGPGKNVLVRRRMVREDTGTHETLTILDDSVAVDEDESGLDPYNTGQFDRSKYWDKRFLK